MKAQVQVVTPSLAKAWLTNRAINRRVSARTVTKYAQLIRDGKWLANGESIKFNDKGQLIDGQHRCLAIERTGQAIKSLVVRGLNGNSFETFDSGKGRSVPDVLSIYGYKNVITLAGVTRLAWVHAQAGHPVSDKHGTVPVQYLVDFLRDPKREDKLIAAAEIGQKTAIRESCFSPRVAAYMAYVGNLVDRKVAAEFFSALTDPRRNDHPVTALLRRVQKSRMTKSRMSLEESLAISIKAWNALYDNQPIAHLRYSMFGEKPENFPDVSGLDVKDL